ncbi:MULTISPECIES: DUF4382 domain-containing protein [Haloprofundus]|uniref:DUF4382 domain-containing protein n=1 Tax=Haloprofundus TaxID=1911573 RepID=UPI000E44ED9B|nr:MULTISPECIES: DUF4382 domain-containing protein [Haloprofundus]QCJ46947.1 DUF4382 domain-containing protein [Haloprofundus sp. MHR1]
MNQTTAVSVLTALLVVLAGCTGGISEDGPSTDASVDTQTDHVDGSDGTVRFYVSDERNAIGDFAHLNVTITKVGLKPTTRDETNATETANGTANGTATEADDSAPEEGWREFDVDERTVDLTRLQGANSTSLGELNVSGGSYGSVFIYVSSVNGTLENGEEVRVKLPSDKLQLHKGFTLGNGEAVDFVFDVSVFEAGKSGKYILKPVIDQSGTGEEVEIVDVDAEDDEPTDRGSDASGKSDTGENGSSTNETGRTNETTTEAALIASSSDSWSSVGG